ncbi:MAG: CarD family transcriptional regulator [bacterium]|nr:CarD family transcriptional regulator [bacterium]
MELFQGQVVAHPHHGPARVTGFTERKVKGEVMRYARLEVKGTGMVVGIPVDRAEEIGVRALLDGEEMNKLFAILVEDSGPEETGWSRRIKAEIQLLRSGDMFKIAGMVRDLTRRQAERGLSLAEKDLLRDASQPLVNEVALCMDVPAEEAQVAVDAAILERIVPECVSVPQVAKAV